MIKYYCDSCGAEMNHPNILQVPCHLYKQDQQTGFYIDKDFNTVSGRMEKIELCNKCSNIAYSAALEAIGLN